VIDDEEMIVSVVGSLLNTLGFEGALVQEGIEGSWQYIQARVDGSLLPRSSLLGRFRKRPRGERS
jgi:hypothetical protein